LPKTGYSWRFFPHLFIHLARPGHNSQETYYFRGVPEVTEVPQTVFPGLTIV
jgi:hypothetical protein